MPKRETTIDSMCIPIAKIDEDDTAAVDLFTATIWAGDPEIRGRSKNIGTATGSFALDKATGETTLLDPMPNDDGDRRYLQACRVIAKHFANG